MPLLGYSIASDLVAAANPPSVSEASTGQPEESDNVDGEDFCEVFLGVVDERFRDENARIVDERVDAPEAGRSFLNDPVSLV
jgi:hypothetical protein